MIEKGEFHIVTVGMSPTLVRDLWNRVDSKADCRISHIAHPAFTRGTWNAISPAGEVRFFRDRLNTILPNADRELLASLEFSGVPTINNMIMSDRVVAKLPYEESLAYATLLAQQLMKFYEVLRPSVVIGGFDALHGSLGFAVAKAMNIPWFALNFSSLPSGQTALCASLSPASKVVLEPGRRTEMQVAAERLLTEFEQRNIEAAAYIPPRVLSLAFIARRIPSQIGVLAGTARRQFVGESCKFTDLPNRSSLSGLFREAIRLRTNALRLPLNRLLRAPPNEPYAFFGLHVQPESSIDVFAHFYSNQYQIVEWIARSLPPTVSLLVKLHKSDVLNYSRAQLARFSALPGVRLVSPYADTLKFIEHANLICSIQGTIGLEGALLGKPVIMFGESPVGIFPSASTVGPIPELPGLIRQKLGENPPARAEIIDAFASYLLPYYPASRNDWTIAPTDSEIEGYVRLFALLRTYLRI